MVLRFCNSRVTIMFGLYIKSVTICSDYVTVLLRLLQMLVTIVTIIYICYMKVCLYANCGKELKSDNPKARFCNAACRVAASRLEKRSVTTDTVVDYLLLNNGLKVRPTDENLKKFFADKFVLNVEKKSAYASAEVMAEKLDAPFSSWDLKDGVVSDEDMSARSLVVKGEYWAKVAYMRANGTDFEQEEWAALLKEVKNNPELLEVHRKMVVDKINN